MKYVQTLVPRDHDIALRRLKDFLPAEVYDIHTHPYHPSHFAPGAWKLFDGLGPQGCAEHRAALQRYMPVPTIHGLYFGMPHKTANRSAMNDWVAGEVQANGTPLSRALMVASPKDDPALVASALRSGKFCGLKVYHVYADRPDTF